MLGSANITPQLSTLAKVDHESVHHEYVVLAT